MSAKVYVGNLSWNTDDDSLRNVSCTETNIGNVADAFSPYGQILDCIVMRDRETNRSRGFGFVTYGSSQEADAAISNMNDQNLDGRTIRVNMANSRPSGGRGGGGGGYSGNSGYSSNNTFSGGGYGGGRGSYNQGQPGGYGNYSGGQGWNQGGGGGGYNNYPSGDYNSYGGPGYGGGGEQYPYGGGQSNY